VQSACIQARLHRSVRTLRRALIFVALSACARGPAIPSGVHVVSADVAAGDGLTCRAHIAWKNEPVTDVFLWMGGTGTGSMAFLSDEERTLVESRAAAIVTFDKPGVSAPFGDPGSVTIDDGPFARHTQGSLLGCADAALRLAHDRLRYARWHARGHSEGALLALYLADQREKD